MKTKIIYTTVLLFLAGVFITGVKNLQRKNDEIKRLKSNIITLTSETRHFTTTDGMTAAETKTLTLTTSELKKENARLVAELNTLQVKARDAKSITNIATTSCYKDIPMKADTVFLHDTVKINYDYCDQWISVSVSCRGHPDGVPDCIANITTYDSLLIVNHCKTRKFLWWTVKKYTGKVSVKNYNPYSSIVNMQTIDVIK
jgi:hypothetical protein